MKRILPQLNALLGNDSALITTDAIGNQWRWDLQPDRTATTQPPSQRPSPPNSATP